MSGAAVGDLTNSALYKMYEITGSCRRWPRMSKPLMSSVTEPPLHSCGEVRETQSPSSLITANYDSWGKAGDDRRTTATNSEKVEFNFSPAQTQPRKILRVLKSLNMHMDWTVCITPACECDSVIHLLPLDLKLNCISVIFQFSCSRGVVSNSAVCFYDAEPRQKSSPPAPATAAHQISCQTCRTCRKTSPHWGGWTRISRCCILPRSPRPHPSINIRQQVSLEHRETA